MSNLRKRNGIYHYDITIKGVRKRGSTGLKDKYLAGLYVNDLITKARTAGIQSLLRESPVLKDFSVEFLQWVEDTHSIEHQTRRYYKNGWRLLKDTVLASKRLDEINNHMCETITFPGGPSSANTALRTLRRMFAKAKETQKFWGELPEIKLRKEWGRSIAMTEQDAADISEHLDGDARDVMDIMRNATPMRPKECFTLRWEYLRFSDSIYQNPNGKSDAARRPILFLNGAMETLKRRHQEQKYPIEGWVFPSPKSGTGHRMTIYKEFEKAREAAGKPEGMVFYTLRHGRATDLAKVATLAELMRVGGWSDAKTAMGYQHPTVDDLRARIEAAKPAGGVQ